MRRLAIVMTVLVFCSVGTIRTQGRYQFRVLADYPAGSQIGAPALNQSGQAGFWVFLRISGDITDLQINRVAFGEPPTRIFGLLGQNAYSGTDGGPVSINDAGTVAFNAQKASPFVPVILAGDGGPLTVIADPSIHSQLSQALSVHSPSIHNSTSAVAFQASFANVPGETVIRVSNGSFTRIAGTGDILPGIGTIFGAVNPTINGTGNVLFSAGGTGQGVIAYGNGSTPSVVATGDVSLRNGFNDLNTACFFTGNAIYKSSSGGPVLIASFSPGGFTGMGSPCAINNSGQVVFAASRPSSSFPAWGVYTGADPVADKVVAPGDTIDGLGVVEYAKTDVEAINDAGQIAFAVSYVAGDGSRRFAIVRADPVTDRDTTPPQIASALPSPAVLWPPNHKMVPVTVSVKVTDNADPAPACAIESVRSNEPIDGLGDGDTAPDWSTPVGLRVDLRAERSGKGTGRVYTLAIQCRDASGNISTTTTAVRVPVSMGQ